VRDTVAFDDKDDDDDTILLDGITGAANASFEIPVNLRS
jgi:hypothetical protein